MGLLFAPIGAPGAYKAISFVILVVEIILIQFLTAFFVVEEFVILEVVFIVFWHVHLDSFLSSDSVFRRCRFLPVRRRELLHKDPA